MDVDLRCSRVVRLVRAGGILDREEGNIVIRAPSTQRIAHSRHQAVQSGPDFCDAPGVFVAGLRIPIVCSPKFSLQLL